MATPWIFSSGQASPLQEQTGPRPTLTLPEASPEEWSQADCSRWRCWWRKETPPERRTLLRAQGVWRVGQFSLVPTSQPNLVDPGLAWFEHGKFHVSGTLQLQADQNVGHLTLNK